MSEVGGMDIDRIIVMPESQVMGLEKKLQQLRDVAFAVDAKFDTDPDFDRQYELEQLIDVILMVTE